MATDAVGEERRQPSEPENLPCPRCDSTNTKFCYYNNYNLSQPRYFCKSCRRYWTRGGTLRNVPVGGGTRKNAKRSRSSTSSSSSSSAVVSVVTPSPPPRLPLNTTSPFENQKVGKTAEIISKWQDGDLELNMNEGSFTSLLTTPNVSNYGLGLGYGIESSGYDDMGFGLGPSAITMGAGDDNQQIGVGQSGGSNNTWQFGGGESMEGGGCFGWPDLAI